MNSQKHFDELRKEYKLLAAKVQSLEKKAKKYDELQAMMAKFYEDPDDDSVNLLTIGEAIASKMGYL